jgi:hypothetical protein
LGRARRVAAFVPIAVLSAAWTAALAGVGVTSAGSSSVSSLTVASTHCVNACCQA